jgi:hypothetical protein
MNNGSSEYFMKEAINVEIAHNNKLFARNPSTGLVICINLCHCIVLLVFGSETITVLSYNLQGWMNACIYNKKIHGAFNAEIERNQLVFLDKICIVYIVCIKE